MNLGEARKVSAGVDAIVDSAMLIRSAKSELDRVIQIQERINSGDPAEVVLHMRYGSAVRFDRLEDDEFTRIRDAITRVFDGIISSRVRTLEQLVSNHEKIKTTQEANSGN